MVDRNDFWNLAHYKLATPFEEQSHNRSVIRSMIFRPYRHEPGRLDYDKFKVHQSLKQGRVFLMIRDYCNYEIPSEDRTHDQFLLAPCHGGTNLIQYICGLANQEQLMQ